MNSTTATTSPLEVVRPLLWLVATCFMAGFVLTVAVGAGRRAATEQIRSTAQTLRPAATEAPTKPELRP